VDILMVDDSPADADLMRIALADGWPECELRVAVDGEQALAVIDEGPVPDLVLLDLNLPRLSGHEVLATLRAAGEPDLRVVILSSSDDPADVRRSGELSARHIVKPHDLDGLFDVVACLRSLR
jgi:chemotaxis family two-component system response regulator Rcp1